MRKGQAALPLTALLGLGRPLEAAARFGLWKRGLISPDDLDDIEQVFGIVRALGTRLTDKSRSHELMVACAVIGLVWLKPYIFRQFETAERFRKLHRID